MSENRRQFFRIDYPTGAGPKLASNGIQLTVVNLSEQGLRFDCQNRTGFTIGNHFAGSLTFADGESFLVFGTIIRILPEGIVVELKKPIPLRIIMNEQRRMIKHFPKRA